MAKRVGLKSGKTSVKRGVQKPSKSAATNGPKAAAAKFAEAPPSPPTIVAAPPEPVAETPAPVPPVGSEPRKSKAKTAPTRPKVASAPASVIAAASPEATAPLPVLEVETAPIPSPTTEAVADVAAESEPVPSPVTNVEPVPEPAPVSVPTEIEAVSEPALEASSPVEDPEPESPEPQSKVETLPSEEAVATQEQEPSTAPLLESLVSPLTAPYSTFLNAIVESSNAATTGLEAISEEITEYGWRQFDEIFAAWKRVLQTSSPAELFQSQCDYARDVLDDFLDQSTKVTFATIRLANEVAEPLARPPQTH